ncbi:MAG: hypothetical protein WBC44_02025 [Planctomycetaceae bacterium]
MSADTPVDSHTARTTRFRFVGLAVVSLTILAFAAAHAPSRLRLLVLFPAFIGTGAGVLVTTLAEKYGVTRRVAIATAAVFVPLMLAGMAAESYRSWRHVRQVELRIHLLAQPGGRAVLDRLASNERPENDFEAEFLDAYRERMNPPVTAYLTERLKGLPIEIPMPWAAVVAVVELLAGWIAGIVAATIWSRPQLAPTESPA